MILAPDATTLKLWRCVNLQTLELCQPSHFGDVSAPKLWRCVNPQNLEVRCNTVILPPDVTTLKLWRCINPQTLEVRCNPGILPSDATTCVDAIILRCGATLSLDTLCTALVAVSVVSFTPPPSNSEGAMQTPRP